MYRAVIVVCLLAGCRQEDPLARSRHEAAELHAALARAAIDFDPARALVAARLAAQADPLDPLYGDLLLRARAANVVAKGDIPREQWAEVEYESEVGEKRDPQFRHLYRGEICLLNLVRADAPTAERDLVPVVAEHPEWAAGQTLLGRIYEATGKPGEALAAYRKALELDRTARAPFLPAARLMLARGEAANAVSTLEAALPFGATLEVELALAEAYDAVSRRTDATAELARAVKGNPNSAQARLRYAEHLTLEGRLAEAELEYLAAGRLGGEPLATRGLGLLAYAQQDWAKAARAFEAVLQLAPKDPSTLFYAADAAEQLKKTQEAAKLYERFVEAALAVPAEADRVATARERIARLTRK